MSPAEALAKQFHDTYERLAPRFDYRTRLATAKPWDEVPEPNKGLMIAVAAEILADAPQLGAVQAAVSDLQNAIEPYQSWWRNDPEAVEAWIQLDRTLANKR